MKTYKKGDKVIRATEKAFRVLYKEQGYKPCNSMEKPVESEIEVPFSDESTINNLQDLTNAEIKEILDRLGIAYGNRDTKAELISKYEAGV